MSFSLMDTVNDQMSSVIPESKAIPLKSHIYTSNPTLSYLHPLNLMPRVSVVITGKYKLAELA